MPEYKSNADVVSKRVIKILGKIQRPPATLMALVGQTIVVMNLDRIHSEGKATDGGSIGYYSTKPTLAGGKTFNNSGAANDFFNDPATEWVTLSKGGRSIRLAVVEGGYKEIRRRDNARTDIVDLKRTGDLFNSFQIIEAATSDGVGVGFTTDKAAEIREGLEDHFSKRIWGLTDEEEGKVLQIIRTFVEQQLK